MACAKDKKYSSVNVLNHFADPKFFSNGPLVKKIILHFLVIIPPRRRMRRSVGDAESLPVIKRWVAKFVADVFLRSNFKSNGTLPSFLQKFRVMFLGNEKWTIFLYRDY